ncbi:YqeG family HAD IIIA-type phosphatase [Synechococcus sp. PCC 6312]|uniref:YqeG family HAD IIIA-type phosphatase n=1 Tax=Synechococcus sp. (strain ATCC 27167 / PCC 6312) TaxID=195253 RepID=UPI00029F3F42|nr:YqeG family HAD IIIA-type phosphatase [Synechococcus sp. PCC 6312]AFY59835.1 HAD phosphatase subfamily IIIA [Synechococcus sp. PCC 6312]
MTPLDFASLLQPNLVLGENVLLLTPSLLLEHDLKGLILDVDDTLVPTWEEDVPPEVLAWLTDIKGQVSLWLVSNNLNHSRIRRIAETLGVPFLMGAAKPSRRKLRQALHAMNLPNAQVAMVGDRVFTDVLAGNRLGMFTILVRPMANKAHPARGIFLIRSLEIFISRLLGADISNQA